jgi:hypothetical protein
MGSSPRAVVCVQPGSALAARPRLFAALAGAFAVRFEPFGSDQQPCDGVIAFGADRRSQADHDSRANRRPVLVVGDRRGGENERETVQLLDARELDPRLRGISLSDRPTDPSEMAGGRERRVLASASSGPVWTVQGSVHRVRCVLPELASGEVLWSLLSERAIAAVALVQFLREVVGGRGWRPPPLRATFLFDDPNLRWRSYGFLSYRQLLRHADEHGYHATIAMIPLDAGRPHQSTARLFAKREDRLSLVFHGNDHVGEELRHQRDARASLMLAAQARRRMDAFERRTGLTVWPVMTPPHGLCSEEMTRALSAVGFDALAGLHPLPWTDRRPAQDVLAGWRPADFVGGCAVIPRIPLESSMASIAHRAFLDHPIVLYGHHQDICAGLDPLAAAAAAVNRLGDVRWMSMGEIATSNAETHQSGDSLVVRPHARRIRMTLPAEARRLTVEAPSDLLEDAALAGWSVSSGPVVAFGEEVTIPPGDLEIRLHGTRDADPRSVSAPAWRPWAKLRRVLTEGRDRALPLKASLQRAAVLR